jgi:hypothetical protein
MTLGTARSGDLLAYDPRLHPELGHDERRLASHNVNRCAHRPRFVDVPELVS